jgi:xanthine dehydrogenase accessory factor
VRDILDDLVATWRGGEPAGLATVTATWSSAPRQPGAAMLVRADGTAAGSVSGGCVESAVYEVCREAAGTGQPRTVRYGVTDSDAADVGLPCGGTIEVFVEPAGFPELAVLADEVAAGRPVALLTCVAGPPDRIGRHLVLTPDVRHGSLGADGIDDAAARDGRDLLAAGRTGLLHYNADGRPGSGVTVLVTSSAPAPRMLVFGATDHAAAVARIGTFLGYRVTACDARPVFATAERFPGAHEVVVDWPHRYLAAEASGGRLDTRTVVCVLTHDAKFDVPVLSLALEYVGAMGSRRTHADRLERLREAGLAEPALARLHSPLGLDLGARTPEETAISVAAEIIAARSNATGRPLTGTPGPIHK